MAHKSSFSYTYNGEKKSLSIKNVITSHHGKYRTERLKDQFVLAVTCDESMVFVYCKRWMIDPLTIHEKHMYERGDNHFVLLFPSLSNVTYGKLSSSRLTVMDPDGNKSEIQFQNYVDCVNVYRYLGTVLSSKVWNALYERTLDSAHNGYEVVISDTVNCVKGMEVLDGDVIFFSVGGVEFVCHENQTFATIYPTTYPDGKVTVQMVIVLNNHICTEMVFHYGNELEAIRAFYTLLKSHSVRRQLPLLKIRPDFYVK